MHDNVRSYQVYSPQLFEDIATLSGLTMDSFIRLSPCQISRFVNSMECFTQGAVNAFVEKIPGLSGDCFVTLATDANGDNVLVFDIVRPDKTSSPGGYVMDQEPIYIWNQNPVCENSTTAVKVLHLDCQGRTFPVSAYNQLSSFIDCRRDVPIPWDEVVGIDPGIRLALTKGLENALSCNAKSER